MSRETLRQILVWVFSSVETRGEVTGWREAGRGAMRGYGPSEINASISTGVHFHLRFNPVPVNLQALSHQWMSG